MSKEKLARLNGYLSPEIPSLDRIRREKARRQARFLAAVAGAVSAALVAAGAVVGAVVVQSNKKKRKT